MWSMQYFCLSRSQIKYFILLTIWGEVCSSDDLALWPWPFLSSKKLLEKGRKYFLILNWKYIWVSIEIVWTKNKSKKKPTKAIKSHKSLAFPVRCQIVQTHVVGGRATSFVRGMLCAMDLVPVSTGYWRRRCLEKSSFLSSLLPVSNISFLSIHENTPAGWWTGYFILVKKFL